MNYKNQRLTQLKSHGLEDWNPTEGGTSIARLKFRISSGGNKLYRRAIEINIQWTAEIPSSGRHRCKLSEGREPFKPTVRRKTTRHSNGTISNVAEEVHLRAPTRSVSRYNRRHVEFNTFSRAEGSAEQGRRQYKIRGRPCPSRWNWLTLVNALSSCTPAIPGKVRCPSWFSHTKWALSREVSIAVETSWSMTVRVWFQPGGSRHLY